MPPRQSQKSTVGRWEGLSVSRCRRARRPRALPSLAQPRTLYLANQQRCLQLGAPPSGCSPKQLPRSLHCFRPFQRIRLCRGPSDTEVASPLHEICTHSPVAMEFGFQSLAGLGRERVTPGSPKPDWQGGGDVREREWTPCVSAEL